MFIASICRLESAPQGEADLRESSLLRRACRRQGILVSEIYKHFSSLRDGRRAQMHTKCFQKTADIKTRKSSHAPAATTQTRSRPG